MQAGSPANTEAYQYPFEPAFFNQSINQSIRKPFLSGPGYHGRCVVRYRANNGWIAGI